jgi:endoribonuclease Dicer
LPPGYHIPKDLDKALILSKLPPSHVSMAQVTALKGMSPSEMEEALKNHSVKSESEFVPYNLVTQQSIPDKSIADCVEALIGAYLTSMGPQGALLFMSWLGIRVLPSKVVTSEEFQKCMSEGKQSPFHMKLTASNEVIMFDALCAPKSPLLRYNVDCEENLITLLKVCLKYY